MRDLNDFYWTQVEYCRQSAKQLLTKMTGVLALSCCRVGKYAGLLSEPDRSQCDGGPIIW